MLSPKSEKTQLDSLRVFLRWCESVDAVAPGLDDKVPTPKLDPDDETRHVMLEDEEAEAMLAYLRKYEYASVDHVVIELLWHTGMRLGAVRGLDVGDYHPDEQYLDVEHRPETDTPIKNGPSGERMVAISEVVCTVLDDWLADPRPDVTDDHGREPLVTGGNGRPSTSTVRRYAYFWTQPCRYGAPCPHDRDPSTCEATERRYLSRCPSSVSPHAFRRGSVTHALNQDVPETVVSDRTNVSLEVLDKHYDRRTKTEKMEQRRQYLDNL